MRLSGQNDLVVGIPISLPRRRCPTGIWSDTACTCCRCGSRSIRRHRSPGICRRAHRPRRGARTSRHHLRPVDSAAEPASRRRPRTARRGRLQRQSNDEHAGLRRPDARAAVPTRSGYNFDVGLDIADTGAELHIECNYDIDLFEAGTIRRWLGVLPQPARRRPSPTRAWRSIGCRSCRQRKRAALRDTGSLARVASKSGACTTRSKVVVAETRGRGRCHARRSSRSPTIR